MTLALLAIGTYPRQTNRNWSMHHFPLTTMALRRCDTFPPSTANMCSVPLQAGMRLLNRWCIQLHLRYQKSDLEHKQCNYQR